MTSEKKETLLIVEDDLDIADMLNAYFRVQGYEVITVNWGEDGVSTCQNTPPDLVILDIRLPDIDGFEVARQLRSNRRTQSIPIIFLTEKRDRVDRLTGLELRAEDYITKPFDITELRLRVRNALRRAQQGSLTNPVTGMPDGSLVDEHLMQFLQSPDRALLLVSLANLDHFREVYGFVASDDLLRAVSLMMQDTVRELCAPDDFLGHMDTSTFLIYTRPANLTALKERIRIKLQQSFEYFYSTRDREGGTFEGEKGLSVQLHELTRKSQVFRDLAELKETLQNLCRS